MKKVHLLAAAMLFAGVANAQSTTRQAFRLVNDCIGCGTVTVSPRSATLGNPNSYTAPSAAQIDNCSEVVQGGAGVEAGNENIAVVDQTGTKNIAKLNQLEGDRNYGRQEQVGTDNRAQANIYGSRNTTLQLQRGSGNRAGINVDQVTGDANPKSTDNGNDNWAQQRQRGAGDGEGTNNIANINQFGNSNLASQDQTGNSNSGNIFQHTNFSTAVQVQTGNSNTAATYQGRDNTGAGNVPAMATESYQRSSILQGGNSNSALVNQDH
ncbi:hypothetical protein HMJ29_06330 [Hymenobacter taeanensis]|uniref:Curlin-associated protein n=1 Tax=Hymenobacter taeanensis TaxID=2735321 RepID=A0A6M6BFR3_9BACT|nr:MULTISPECIES: hypothetical protein [Hymenobacter]QJX46574.1 hypothetical protein HMJ29_06330 [Hymenobacter taeanensis]UOQ80434.1 hypothetical protein MUN83_16645 [Hymenobacter sp. 5414T-23]